MRETINRWINGSAYQIVDFSEESLLRKMLLEPPANHRAEKYAFPLHWLSLLELEGYEGLKGRGGGVFLPVEWNKVLCAHKIGLTDEQVHKLISYSGSRWW